MKIRAYTITHHTNFAPHVANGLLSLANCKPGIREKANVGDWIAGISPKRLGTRLVYLMQVTGEIDRGAYWEKFGLGIKRRWDAIYQQIEGDQYIQHPNKWHKLKHQDRDLSSNRILLSNNFQVFSDTYSDSTKEPKGISLPARYSALLKPGLRRYGELFDVPGSLPDWLQKQSYKVNLRNLQPENVRLGCSCK
jgi:hypothetical protein